MLGGPLGTFVSVTRGCVGVSNFPFFARGESTDGVTLVSSRFRLVVLGGRSARRRLWARVFLSALAGVAGADCRAGPLGVTSALANVGAGGVGRVIEEVLTVFGMTRKDCFVVREGSAERVEELAG